MVCESSGSRKVLEMRFARMGAVLAFVVMVASGVAPIMNVSADSSWGTILPGIQNPEQGGYTTGVTVIGQTQTARVSDANSEVVISAVMEQIQTPVGGTNYWDIPVLTTVAADTLGFLAYGDWMLETVTNTVWEPPYGLSLADEGGAWVDLHASGVPSDEFLQFYGMYYDTMYICANGYVILGANPDDLLDSDQGATLPRSSVFSTSGAPAGTVAPLFLDFDPTKGNGMIYYGYEWNTNSFVVWWDEVVPYGYMYSYPYTFWVRFDLTTSTQTGMLGFDYGYVTMPSTFDPRRAVGHSDPTGRWVHGETSSWPTSQREIQYIPDAGLDYSVESIAVFAQKFRGTTASPQNDPNGWIPTATGVSSTYPAGLNMKPANYVPPPEYQDVWHKLGAVTADYAISNIPIVGDIYSAGCYLYDVGEILWEYESVAPAAQPPSSLPSVGTGDTVPCAYNGETLSAMTQNLNSVVKTAWVVPVFEWRINNQGTALTDNHLLKLWTVVTIKKAGAMGTYTLTTQTSAIWFILKGGTLLTDNFDGFVNDVGILYPWAATANTGGTVEVSSAAYYPANLAELYPDYKAGSLHCYAPNGQVARAWLNVANWDATKSYEVDFHFRQSGAGHENVLYDDGRVMVHMLDSSLYALTSSGDLLIRSYVLSAWQNVWHSIIIKVNMASGQYTVTVDDTASSSYNIRSYTQNRVITVGSQATVVSGPTIDDYWDLFGLAGSVSTLPPLEVTGTASPTSGAAPLAVSFTCTPSGDVSPYSYSWAFGDGATSTQQNPTHSYAIAGTYTAIVTVTSAASQVDTWSSTPINVGPPVSVTGTAAPTSGVFALTVSFTSTPSNGYPPYSFSWAFGDGGTSTLQNPSHTYSAAGTFTATVTVTDSRSTTATWTSPMITAIDLAPTTPGIPYVDAGDQNDGGFTLKWTASVDSDPTPVYRYYLLESMNGGQFTVVSQMVLTNSIDLVRSPGSYIYWVQAYDSAGYHSDWAKMTTPIVVPPLPSATGTASPTSGLVALVVSFTCTASSGVAPYTYFWDFGDGGTSTLQNPTHSYTAGGTYTAAVIVKDAVENKASWTSPVISVSDNAPTTPGIPHLLSPGDESDGTFVLTWTASQDTDGTPLAYYYLVEKADTGGGWSPWVDISQTLTTNSITLTRAPGSYLYAVCAGDTADKWSSWAVMPTPPMPGAQPIVVPVPDSVPPVTTATLYGSLGSNGWYASDVSVTLSATDKNGVAKTYYKLDNAHNYKVYSGPITVSDGQHTVYFYSVDTLGYTEDAKSVVVKVDKTPPTTTASVRIKGTTATVTLKATDSDSGVAATYYSLDNGATWLPYTAAFKVTGSGSYTVLFYSVDKAGNQGTIGSTTFILR